MKHESYIKPGDCRSPKTRWNLIKVLTDRGENDVSLAVGLWDGKVRVAIRWNGSAKEPIGNPQSRAIPTWLMLPDDYAELLIKEHKELNGNRDFVQKLMTANQAS
jgi:hypothetical protein